MLILKLETEPVTCKKASKFVTVPAVDFAPPLRYNHGHRPLKIAKIRILNAIEFKNRHKFAKSINNMYTCKSK